jgi:NAD(P)-dependent dehydrogenase (short-subunit alcohol dehydrogenase family)
MGRLDEKVAIVTGGGTGIGREIALPLASCGASVVVAGRTRSTLAETVAMVEAAGGTAVATIADTSVERDVEALFARCTDEFARLDVLVNNAAIAGPVGPIWDLDREGWEQAIAVNLTGPWLCSRAAAKWMVAQRSGRIVNIGSLSGKRALANRTPYTTTKLGLVGLTRTLALELGPYGVTVNTVSPGAVATERLDLLAELQGRRVDDLIAEFSELTALGRLSKPADIAAAVTFLASDEAQSITGVDLTVDAGVWLQ